MTNCHCGRNVELSGLCPVCPSKPEPVLTKPDMYRRFLAGEFGNIYPHYTGWPQAFAAMGVLALSRTLWNIRSMTPGGRFERDLSYQSAKKATDSAAQYWPTGYVLVPTISGVEAHRTMNAELTISPSGLYLYYSTAPGYMRESLAAGGRHAERSAAVAILRHYLNDSSYDDLQILIENYPDHVIELSSYSVNFGSVLHRNCVCWEVRKY